MFKKLVQYGGYILSGILIAWLINPILAINCLQILLKSSAFILIPITGIYILNRIIDLRYQKAWNISVLLWLGISIYIAFLVVKHIKALFG